MTPLPPEDSAREAERDHKLAQAEEEEKIEPWPILTPDEACARAHAARPCNALFQSHEWLRAERDAARAACLEVAAVLEMPHLRLCRLAARLREAAGEEQR